MIIYYQLNFFQIYYSVFPCLISDPVHHIKITHWIRIKGNLGIGLNEAAILIIPRPQICLSLPAAEIICYNFGLCNRKQKGGIGFNNFQTKADCPVI